MAKRKKRTKKSDAPLTVEEIQAAIHNLVATGQRRTGDVVIVETSWGDGPMPKEDDDGNG